MIGEQISVPLEMMTLFIKTLKKLPPLRTSYIGYISLDVPPNPNRWLDLDFEVLRFWSLFKRENLNNFAGFPRPHSKKTVKSATWHQMFLKIEAGGANREIWHQYLLHKKPSQKHLILISKFSSKTATNHLFLHFLIISISTKFFTDVIDPRSLKFHRPKTKVAPPRCFAPRSRVSTHHRALKPSPKFPFRFRRVFR